MENIESMTRERGEHANIDVIFQTNKLQIHILRAQVEATLS